MNRYPQYPYPGPYVPTPADAPLPAMRHQYETGPAPQMVRTYEEYPPPPYGFLEGQREWQETDSTRWGDSDAVELDVPIVAIGLPITGTSRQLVNGHVPRPLTWLLQFNATSVAGALGAEASNIVADFAVTLGCGQGRTTIHTQIVLTAAGGYLPPNPPPQLLVPAGDIQVIATVTIPAPTVAGAHVIQVGAMIAPWSWIPVQEKLR